jgi:hypothetical protein
MEQDQVKLDCFIIVPKTQTASEPQENESGRVDIRLNMANDREKTRENGEIESITSQRIRQIAGRVSITQRLREAHKRIKMNKNK